jgi:hypothetical protein
MLILVAFLEHEYTVQYCCFSTPYMHCIFKVTGCGYLFVGLSVWNNYLNTRTPPYVDPWAEKILSNWKYKS